MLPKLCLLDKIHAVNHRAALASLGEESTTTTQKYSFTSGMGDQTVRSKIE
jgi:hypothetical protein